MEEIQLLYHARYFYVHDSKITSLNIVHSLQRQGLYSPQFNFVKTRKHNCVYVLNGSLCPCL